MCWVCLHIFFGLSFEFPFYALQILIFFSFIYLFFHGLMISKMGKNNKRAVGVVVAKHRQWQIGGDYFLMMGSFLYIFWFFSIKRGREDGSSLLISTLFVFFVSFILKRFEMLWSISNCWGSYRKLLGNGMGLHCKGYIY